MEKFVARSRRGRAARGIADALARSWRADTVRVLGRAAGLRARLGHLDQVAGRLDRGACRDQPRAPADPDGPRRHRDRRAGDVWSDDLESLAGGAPADGARCRLSKWRPSRWRLWWARQRRRGTGRSGARINCNDARGGVSGARSEARGQRGRCPRRSPTIDAGLAPGQRRVRLACLADQSGARHIVGWLIGYLYPSQSYHLVISLDGCSRLSGVDGQCHNSAGRSWSFDRNVA